MGEMLPKLKKSKPKSLPDVICSMYLRNMTLPCKISKQKACWKCCKTPRKVTEIFCVNTENFQQANMIDIICFDLSKTNILAEK